MSVQPGGMNPEGSKRGRGLVLAAAVCLLAAMLSAVAAQEIQVKDLKIGVEVRKDCAPDPAKPAEKAAANEEFPAGTTRGVFFEEDGEAGARLRKAAELQRADLLQPAFDLYQWVLENAAEGMFRLDENRYLNVRRYCMDRLKELPPKFLTEYRLKIDDEVARLYKDARRKSDPEELERLSIKRLLSSYAPEMLDLAADLYAGRGDYAGAASCWRRFLDWGLYDEKTPRELIEAKLALALAMNGREREARELVAELRRRNPAAQAVIAGEQRRVVDYLESALPKPGAASVQPLGPARDHWPQFGGDATHSSTVPARFNCDVKLSAVPIRGAPVQEIVRQRVPSRGVVATELVAPMYPVFARGRIFVHDQGSISAYRADTMCEDWFVGESTPGGGGVYVSSGRMGRVIARGPVRTFACSWADGVVYGSLNRAPAGFEVWAVSEEGRMLWRVTRTSKDFDWLGDITDIGDPVPWGGNLYFTVTRGEQARSECFLVCVAAADGRFNWKRFICSGAFPYMYSMGMDTRQSLSLPAVDESLVVVCSNLGGIAAVDARTGDVRWGFAYERAIQSRYAMVMMGDEQRDQGSAVRNSTPVLVDGRIYLMPADGNAVISLDLRSGRGIWSWPRRDVERIVGIAGDRLILSGEKIVALDASTGKPAWSIKTSDDAGQGVITGDAVYVPGRDAICRINPNDGKVVGQLRVSAQEDEYGNMIAVDDFLVQVGNRIHFYGLWDRVYNDLEKQIREHPGDATPRFKLGLMYARKEAREEAIKQFEAALRLMQRDTETTGAVAAQREEAKQRLYALLSEEFDRSWQAGDAAASVELASRARAHVTTETQKAETAARLIKGCQKQGDWPGVVRELQGLLDDPPKAPYAYEGDSIIAPELYGYLKIQEIIAKQGRKVYAEFDAKADKLYVEGVEAGMEKVVKVFPNSLAARRALLKLSDLRAGSGKYGEAARCIENYLRLTDKDDPERPQVMWKVAHFYEQQGQYRSARVQFETLARDYPDATVGKDDARRRLADAVAAKLKEDPYAKALRGVAAPRFRAPLHEEKRAAASGNILPLVQGLAGDAILIVDRNTQLRCVDGVSGGVRWTMALNGRYPSSAAIEGPRLLLCDGQSLTLVNYETGAQLWSYGVGPNPVARALKPQVMGNFMMQGATLSERFVAAHVTMPEGQLLVLDAADGKVLWKNKLQGTPVGSPVFWRDSILSASSTGVALFDAATGKKLQEWGHQSLIRPPDVIPGDRVLVSTNAFIFCYSLTTGQRLWSKPFNPFGWVSSLVPDRVGDKDCLIMAVAGNKVVCVDAATGQEIWSRASDANEQVQGQLQVVDDMVCFIRMKQTPPTFECRVAMLDAKTGQEKWVSAVLKDVNIFDLVVGTDAVAALTSRMERQANVGPRYVSAEIYCFDRATGQVVQSVKPAKQGNVGFGFGKLVAVDRMLWIVSYNDIVGFKGE